jgi:hypothetical protein
MGSPRQPRQPHAHATEVAFPRQPKFLRLLQRDFLEAHFLSRP